MSRRRIRNIRKNKNKLIFIDFEMDKASLKRTNEDLIENNDKKMKPNPVNWDDEYDAYKGEMEVGNQTIMAQQWFYNVPEESKWSEYVAKMEKTFGPVSLEESRLIKTKKGKVGIITFIGEEVWRKTINYDGELGKVNKFRSMNREWNEFW